MYSENSANVNRRNVMCGLAATFLAGSLLPSRSSLGSVESRSAKESNGLWFEFSDGYYYRCDYEIDGDGIWVDEHDGYVHHYPEFEMEDNGIWLGTGDGTLRYQWCFTDEAAPAYLEMM